MLLTALEVAFILLAIAGVALWSVPAAMLVAGVVGALACEYRQRVGARAPGERHEEPRS